MLNTYVVLILLVGIVSYLGYFSYKLNVDNKYYKARSDLNVELLRDVDLLKNTIKENNVVIQELQEALEREALNNREVVSRKISSEVRLGNYAENILSLLKECPYKPDDMIHLGRPIDFLVIDYDKEELIIVEHKTGKAKLNTHQRKIKSMVNRGRVYFEEITMKENKLEYTRDKRRDSDELVES